MPERINFWGIPHEPIPPEFYIYPLLGLAFLILVIRFYFRFRVWWRVGLPDRRWDRLNIRIVRLIKYALVQTRILRQRYPGFMHIALAWSFFVFFLGTVLATIDADFAKILVGEAYLVFKFVLDMFTVFFFIGVGIAVYRRYIQKPSGLTLSTKFTYALILITIIVLGGLFVESVRLAVERPEWALASPAGWLVAQIWIAMGTSEETLLNWHYAIWLLHIITVAIALVLLPVSTLVHILSAPLNVFFSDTKRKTGQLAPVKETDSGASIYVSKLKDLTWKQLMDGDACTECGRCQDVCPAFAAGTLLNPKMLILDIRESLHQVGSVKGSSNGNSSLLVGEAIQDEVLWSCTTCGACVRECPVLIEHVDTIVDMRRYLVMEGRIDNELQDALANVSRYGNSFGKSERARARWARKVKPKIKDARKEPVEYLWFVGDYASYSSTLTDVTKLTAAVFQQAGLDFGILYEGEKHSGNDIRRVGEEGLFEVLMEDNLAVMSKCDYQTVITTDPHTYNTLKNEYPSNGDGNRHVLHYTELLDQLIASKQLELKEKLGYRVTYHDPCYLARYNQISDAPRRLIETTGCELLEMPRHGDRTFCCGAGGGRIWMEDNPDIKERPAENRLREAAALPGVSTFVVTCPKDLVMFQDAAKTTGLEEKIAVKDIIELISEALEEPISEDIE